MLVVFRCNLFDPPQFLSGKASTSFKADRIEPNLRFAIITFYMYVRRFITIAGIEEESIWANTLNGRHQSFANRVSRGKGLVCRATSFGQNDEDHAAGNKLCISRDVFPLVCIRLFWAIP